MYRVGNGQYLTLLIGAFCCIVLDNRWFSDFWPKDRCRVFFFFLVNFVLNTMNISLLGTGRVLKGQ